MKHTEVCEMSYQATANPNVMNSAVDVLIYAQEASSCVLKSWSLKTTEDFNQFTALTSVLEMDRNAVSVYTRN